MKCSVDASSTRQFNCRCSSPTRPLDRVWLPLALLMAVWLVPCHAQGQVATGQVGGGRQGTVTQDKDDRPQPIQPPLAQEPRRFQSSVRSWRSIQRDNIVMQRHDYSCGAAALATIIRYYFEDPVTELELLDEILGRLSDEERADREENGLSMDDLFRAARDRGYQATVYPLTYTQLRDIQAPVIVRLEKDDFKHFVVYRGAIEDRLYLADPLRGNVRMQAYEFADQWNGVALILGKAGFGLPEEHPLAVGQPKLFRHEIQAARQHLNKLHRRR